MANSNNQSKVKQADNLITFKELFYLCLRKWYWFVISLAITLSFAVMYILTTPPTYTRNASLLIKDENSSMADAAGVFGDIVSFRTSTNINNELQSIQSPSVMLEAVRRLKLNVNYSTDGGFYDRVLYGKNLPYKVELIDFPDTESATFTMSPADDGKVRLSELTKKGEELDCEISATVNDTIDSPYGRLLIKQNENYVGQIPEAIKVSVSSIQSASRVYSAKLSANLSENSTVINMSISDQSTERAEDVLNAVISVYNENWMADKNQIANSTSMFINERLALIEQELGNVDENIASYKSQHQLPDVQAAANLFMTQSSELSAEIANLNTQLSIARYIRNSLSNPTSKNQLLPANSGIESRGIESQISEYNTMLLRRNDLVASSSETNPLVVDLDQSLNNLRSAIISSIDNQINMLNTQLGAVQARAQQTSARISANPTQGKNLLSDERKQKVKETQYLFLLQKREENELSKAFTAYNTRVIMNPTGSNAPTAPVSKNIFLVAFAIGLLIPMVIVFIRETSNTKLRGRLDLEGLSIPYIGEIPQIKSGRMKRKAKLDKKIVIKHGKRDIINEAFRVVRTNFEFILDANGNKNGADVSVITSFNSGSGKTFISMNAAASFAIKGKRVLVIDGDLRRCMLSTYVGSPQRGLSDYLANREQNVDKLIVSVEAHPGLFVLPSGTVPPNPTELLSEPRMAEMIEYLRGQFDYIFIDCPPVDIVADTQIIEKLADRTIFIVRVGLLERELLAKLQSDYDEKRFKNIVMLLNGSESAVNNYRYGYSYGYDSNGYYGS